MTMRYRSNYFRCCDFEICYAYFRRMRTGIVGTEQIAPPLPGKPKTRPCAGFFVPATFFFDVRFTPKSYGMDSSSPNRHLSAKLVSDTTSKRKRGVHHEA